MILKSLRTATLMAMAVLVAGCGAANPAASLSECILEGAQKLATSSSETHSMECELQMTGPYKLMSFPPRQFMDGSAYQQAETSLVAAAKTDRLPVPAHESIWIIPGDGQKEASLSYRKSFVPFSQLFSLEKSDPKLTVLLRKTATGIEVAELR
jgi:hypothetical protein